MMLKKLLSDHDFEFLEKMARDVLAASTVLPNAALSEDCINRTGHTLILPGGTAFYPAFWTRDFIMSLESGLIPEATTDDLFGFLLSRQAQRRIELPSGAVIPAGSITDHINGDGTPIYFPGTYDPEKQGIDWGRRPPFDDEFFLIECAWYLTRKLKDDEFAKLKLAFNSVPAGDDGLVSCNDEDYGVSFGFMDSVMHTGKLLFASLLRSRAARMLADLFTRNEKPDEARFYTKLNRQISAAIETTFPLSGGMLKASTGKSSQPDVWGSAFAVYYGLVSTGTAKKVAGALLDAFRRNTISGQGGICHVPNDCFFSEKTAWESALTPIYDYQNGPYWGTPLGWVAYTLTTLDCDAARLLIEDYLKELREHDFRLGKPEDGFGAPYECRYFTSCLRNPIYLTSIMCPFAALKRLRNEAAEE